MKLNNIRVLVNDFEKSFSFYNEVLGLNCTWGDKNGVYASFDMGLPSALCIFKAELMAESISGKYEPVNSQSLDKVAIIIEVDDVDKTYDDLKSKSVQFITTPKDMQAWGIRTAHFRDTEGNLLEIFSNLPGNI